MRKYCLSTWLYCSFIVTSQALKYSNLDITETNAHWIENKKMYVMDFYPVKTQLNVLFASQDLPLLDI